MLPAGSSDAERWEQAGSHHSLPRSGWDRDGKGQGLVSLNCAVTGYGTLSPNQHPGCMEVAPKLKVSPVSH